MQSIKLEAGQKEPPRRCGQPGFNHAVPQQWEHYPCACPAHTVVTQAVHVSSRGNSLETPASGGSLRTNGPSGSISTLANQRPTSWMCTTCCHGSLPWLLAEISKRLSYAIQVPLTSTAVRNSQYLHACARYTLISTLLVRIQHCWAYTEYSEANNPQNTDCMCTACANAARQQCCRSHPRSYRAGSTAANKLAV